MARIFCFYLDCLTAGARWAVAPEAYYNYSVRGGSLTETVADADRVRIIDKFGAFVDGACDHCGCFFGGRH